MIFHHRDGVGNLRTSFSLEIGKTAASTWLVCFDGTWAGIVLGGQHQ